MINAMAYELYGARGSGSSLIEATFLELGVDYIMHTLDAANGEHLQDEYAAINPHRKMPTLITPQGETLTESSAIVVTLCERHPQAALLPPLTTASGAQALRWMMFVASELYPVVEMLDCPERFDAEGTKRIRERALEIWKTRWRVVEDALGEGPYLLGERFCATDIYLGALSRWDMTAAWRSEHLPKLSRLSETLAQRSKLRELIPTHFPIRG